MLKAASSRSPAVCASWDPPTLMSASRTSPARPCIHRSAHPREASVCCLHCLHARTKGLVSDKGFVTVVDSPPHFVRGRESSNYAGFFYTLQFCGEMKDMWHLLALMQMERHFGSLCHTSLFSYYFKSSFFFLDSLLQKKWFYLGEL
jgi:hypothetical protein